MGSQQLCTYLSIYKTNKPPNGTKFLTDMYRLQQQQFLSGGARVERSALGGSSLTLLPFHSIPLSAFKENLRFRFL